MGLVQAAREVWSRLAGDEFAEVFQNSWPSEKPFENVWREWVKKVSKLPQGSQSSHHSFENHLKLRAPMARQERTDTKTRKPQGHWQRFRCRFRQKGKRQKAKARNEHQKHGCAVEKKDTIKQIQDCDMFKLHTRLRRMQVSPIQKALSK